MNSYSYQKAARRSADLYAEARTAAAEGRADAVALQRAAREWALIAAKRRAEAVRAERARAAQALANKEADARFCAMMIEKARKAQTGSVADWAEYVRYRAAVDPNGRFS